MDTIFQSLLILMAAVWIVAIVLRPFGVPTVMGELIVGVIVGPAVFGWIEPNQTIEVLASLGLTMGAIDQTVFSALVFTAFLLNLITPALLIGCVTLLTRDGTIPLAAESTGTQTASLSATGTAWLTGGN